MAVGAAAFSHFASGYHWPWLVALIASGLIAVPIGAVLAIPAIRLSGLYLALATFGFGVILSYMFYTSSFMFGSLGLGLQDPMPQVSWLSLDTNQGYYYLVLVLTAVVAAAVILLTRSRLGRLLRAISDSPNGVSTAGASINVTRVLVFCLSAFLAAVAGALAGGASGVVTAASYQPLTSLTYFAVVVITVGAEPWYALIAAAGLTLIPSYFQNANVGNYLQLIFGLAALMYCVSPESSKGVPLLVRRLADRMRRPRRSATTEASGIPSRATTVVRIGSLDAAGVRVQFGGLSAVNDVSLRAPTGAVTGLIGPNGAGKTSLFDACSGLNRAVSGSIRLDGTEMIRRGPAARAREGLRRTFQQMELFDSQSVYRNVAIGVEASFAGANPLRHMLATRRERLAVRSSAIEALTWCGIQDIADRQVGALSTGQRRLVEFARCIAGGGYILLLDEPSSGLDKRETERFGQIIVRAVKERGVGVLIVEHDMALVASICNYIYVLDFGQLLFEGTPNEVLSSAVVRDAYLGQDDVEMKRIEDGSGDG
jgi:ABC-type branched-subunit amino acid transport system ATPase component/ABC-type branched-subunit amino acid transport system permease subunit